MGVADLATIREQIKLLQERERNLVAILKDQGVGVYCEGVYLAMVSEQSRNVVNIEGIRTKYPRIADEFTNTTQFLVVKTTKVS